SLNIESVLVVVQIDGGVGAKVHRIGTGDERAVIVVRIKLLHGHGFPAAGGTAVDEPSPALADAPELFLNRRDQFRLDGVAIGAEVRGIHRVGIVIVRIGMIDFRNQDAWEPRRNPLLIELVGFLLLDAVVTGNVESLAVIGLQVGIGWLGSKALKIRVEVVLGDDQRIRNMGVG